MEFDPAALLALFAQPTTWVIIATTLISGIVRGFSGFGGALILIPIMSALVGPKGFFCINDTLQVNVCA